MPKKRSEKQKSRWMLTAMLAAGFAVQIFAAGRTEGHMYDTGCFFAWALRMADVGAGGFYTPEYFCDYPPGYLWVLGFVGRVMRGLHLSYSGAAAHRLLCLVPILCTCGMAALMWHIAAKKQKEQLGLLLAACVLLCPVLLYDNVIWKQVDAAFALPMVVCFWLLSEKKYLFSALLFGLALAVKPQALLAGPVLAAAFLLPLLKERTAQNLLRPVWGAAAALGVTCLAALPFYGAGVVPALWAQYMETSSSYPYAVINAFNFASGMGGNWVSQNMHLGPLTWQTWGILALVLLTAGMAALAVISERRGTFCPMLLAALYTVGVFTFSHRMHERYVIFGIMLAVAAAAKWGDRRLLLSAAGLSLVSFINLVLVCDHVGTEDEFMTGNLPALMLRIGGLAETCCFILLAYGAVELLLGYEVQPIVIKEPAPPALPLPQPRWSAKEKLCLAGLTFAVLALSLWNLGDMAAPQKPLKVDGTAVLSVSTDSPAAQLWVYPGVNYTQGELFLRDGVSGVSLGSNVLNYSDPFSWQRLELPENSGVYEITLSQCTVMELSFRDADGAPLAAFGGEGTALFDEQTLVPNEISYKNSTYFDEIYHARTGYEMGHRMTVYETTHPPLGKDLIMLGILLFGMTGFGWRIMGALFGAAMVPVFYLLVRRLTRSPKLAMVGGVLLALDGFRFVQTRIATIDVYATFFILLSALFMVWYAQTALARGIHHAVLPMALCGFAFGLGCASKWTGMYAGVGLAIIYFWVIWARWRQGMPSILHEAALAVVGGVIFFVVVPLAVYLAAYLPYWWKDPSFSLSEWWHCQTYMYWYHSNLEATHPFESRWYTWPLSLRPVWYYMGSKARIVGMPNPIVWWASTAGLVTLAGRQLSGRGDRRGAAVLVLWLVQVMPWLLVSRCTFLYHYFPGVLFALLALMLTLDTLRREDSATAKKLIPALLAVSAVCFVLFYPVYSGLPVAGGWLQWLKWMPTWGW